MSRFKASFIIVGAALLAVSVPAYAQHGCVNSPENPTALLLVIATGGALVAQVRGRRR